MSGFHAPPVVFASWILAAASVTAGEAAYAVDRVDERDLRVARSLLWDAGEETWLAVAGPDGATDPRLDGDLRLRLADGWPSMWSSHRAGDAELTLRFRRGRVRLLVWGWSATWRGHHLGMVRSVTADGDAWRIELDLEREFPFDYYNPQRVLEIVPGGHYSLRLHREGTRVAGTWRFRQGGYRGGVYASEGRLAGSMTPAWPADADDAPWPHAGARPRLGTRPLPAGAVDAQLAWLRGVWNRHDWRPFDPDRDEDHGGDSKNPYRRADMELRRLRALPQTGERLREVATSAAVIDRLWPHLDELLRVQCRTWLLRQAEWCYVRSLEFTADAPWAGQYLGVAALCCCVVHGEHGDLQRRSYATNLLQKAPLLPPPAAGVPAGDGVPEIGIPLADAFTDWVLAGPVPGTEHEDLFADCGGPVGLRLRVGQTIELAGARYPCTRTGEEHLVPEADCRVLDLGRLADGVPGRTVVLYTVVDVPVRGLVLVKLRSPGVRAWLADREVANDESLRLEAGRYPLLVQLPVPYAKGPGGRRIPAVLRILPKPDRERFAEPFRQYLERDRLLPRPYLLAPRIEEGLRRWLDAAVGAEGTLRPFACDWRLLDESYPELPLRFVLPAIGAWRRSFGRDLAARPRVAALGAAYLQACRAAGHRPDRDVLLGCRLAGLPAADPPAGTTAANRFAEDCGSALPARWHACFPDDAPDDHDAAPPGGLRADADTGVVLYAAPRCTLRVDAVHAAGLDSPATAGHLELRGWGRRLLAAAPARRPWLGEAARGNRPLPAGANPFLGGRLVRAEATTDGCRLALAFPLRGPAPRDGWAADGRTVGFLEGSGVDGRGRFVLDAFPERGTALRRVELAAREATLSVHVHDRIDRAGDGAPARMVLHTGLGPWRADGDGVWTAAAADGPALRLRVPGAAAAKDPALPPVPGLHRLALTVPDDTAWTLTAVPAGATPAAGEPP